MGMQSMTNEELVDERIETQQRSIRRLRQKLKAREKFWEEKLKQFSSEHEALKCCGNCAHVNLDSIYFCTHSGLFRPKNKICNYWQFDNMTREERET